ncbi:nickel transporter [Sphingomonas sp. Leaf231]|uniref:HoxN/HupN/NixA family nickel/cobalt transporter n=1 Tax=Sphingomonas sp. Leaf231 TaxID=1736301 RepID=UPI0006FD2A0E|nr:HoxN/HupN/NixA family nickel/cobalt transporter [Sphingomonas sp. Leaf231]KQN94368.1 nickel transporter [Sphingomonas sp. Leaf231]
MPLTDEGEPATIARATGPARLRTRIGILFALLLAANLGAWLWAGSLFHAAPAMLATALLAWTLGLRHAVDADHIAAIDNVTRKLMQDGARPIGVGLWFAIGHSAVILIASVAIAATATALARFETLKAVGGVIATLFSAGFLFAIAAINLIILRSVWRTFRHVRAGGDYDQDDLDMLLAGRGPLSRLFRPLFRLIDRPWHMAPLGFLFGLGFDTATEIAILGLSAAQAGQGFSLAAVLVFPALFAVGMALVDTADGVLMLGAYEWAFVHPIRKLYYNVTITAASALVAVMIGGIETAALLADKLELSGGVWDLATALGSRFNMLGFIIIGLFGAAWLVSFAVYRWMRFEDRPIRG